MGLWSGIKYALNSTLGTDDFESLDKMIYGTKTLKKSENMYALINKTYQTASSTVDETLDIPLNIKFKWGGTAGITFKGYAKAASANTYTDAHAEIYKNGELYKEQVIKYNEDAGVYYNVLLEFNRGDIFTIKLKKYASGVLDYATITLDGIYADIFDGSGVCVEEV